ncbi:hypothetical protein MiSe_18670 [Microseira wollei NIES-4236]|uniref:Uncharacterized protein n=1 Tax=Microseira wollei NIES-4236 TaxID=2530354 RepID=A0AAV3X4S4_9CYAN|nr:hypothetical protein MiSe_18670 [Microseira wollei NIES-4236]
MDRWKLNIQTLSGVPMKNNPIASITGGSFLSVMVLSWFYIMSLGIGSVWMANS